jgi:hypothetical protein
MQLSETIVIAFGTLLFFGFAVWMAFYSRRISASDQSQAGQPKNTGETELR